MRRILFAIIAGLSISCAREISPVQPEIGGSFTASFINFSKTSVSGTDVLWDKDDLISINGFQYKAKSSGANVSFEAIGKSAPEADEYIATYPSSLQLSGNTVTGILDSDQTARAGNVCADCNHAVAQSAKRQLYFRNLLSLLKIKINAPGVIAVTLESNSNEPLSGQYTTVVSEDTPSVKPDSPVKSSVTLAPESGCIQEDCTYLFSAFPTTLAGGLKITFTFDAEHGGGSWSKTTSNRVELKRSTILDLGVFDYDFKTGTGTLELENSAWAEIDPGSALSEPVGPLLFGSFGEMHGGDFIPGIYEQYLVNQSFEEWYTEASSSKTELVFTDVSPMSGVAYPWQKRNDSGTPEVSITTDCYNTKQAQLISLSSGQKATLYQKVALPVYRTMKYKVKFFAKMSGTVSLSVGFSTTGFSSRSESFTPEGLCSDWKCFEQEFTLQASESYKNDRYGIYNLAISASGEGTVTIDNVTLIPSDAIEGKFNPETVQYFKDYKVASIRWPGGNFTTQYHWKYGIGPIDKRPVLPNRAWNGLDPNILGMDEIMRFCEITGVELVMGVGVGEITTEEIADWVEYCNGSTSTAMGALRAANGHPEPYKVKYWGVGNEVYYYDSVQNYISKLTEISSAIKAVDPSVEVIASAFGIHNIYRNPSSSWNATLLDNASSSFDLLDTHYYVYGPEEIDSSWTPEMLIIYYAAANLYYRQQLEAFKKHPSFPGKKLSLTEWGVLPSGNNNTPKRQTFSNLVASACLYNEFVRQSDVVQLTCLHNFSFYVAPQSLHSEPVNPRTLLFKEFSPLAGGYSVKVDNSGIPTYDITFSFVDVGKHDNVPYLDIAAVKKGDVLYVSIANRNPSSSFMLKLPVKTASIASGEGVSITSTNPYVIKKWNQYSTLEPTITDIEIRNLPGNSPVVRIPEMSYTMLKLNLSH